MESGETMVSLEKAVTISNVLGIDFDAMCNFSPSNYLHMCTQSGVWNTNNNLPSELLESMKNQIDLLVTEIEFLRAQLQAGS